MCIYPNLIRRHSGRFLMTGILLLLATLLASGCTMNTVHYKAEHGDLEGLVKMHSEGLNIDTSNESGKTPLFLATRMNHVEVVRYLLEQGANLNKKQRRSFSPLWDPSTPWAAAAKGGNIEILSLYFNHGLTSSAKDSRNRNLLHWAAIGKEPEAIRFLVDKGVLLNQPDEDGATPLTLAVYSAGIGLHGDSTLTAAKVIEELGGHANPDVASISCGDFLEGTQVPYARGGVQLFTTEKLDAPVSFFYRAYPINTKTPASISLPLTKGRIYLINGEPDGDKLTVKAHRYEGGRFVGLNL